MVSAYLLAGVLPFFRDPYEGDEQPMRALMLLGLGQQLEREAYAMACLACLTVLLLHMPLRLTKAALPGMLPLRFSLGSPFAEAPTDLLLFHFLLPLTIPRLQVRWDQHLTRDASDGFISLSKALLQLLGVQNQAPWTLNTVLTTYFVQISDGAGHPGLVEDNESATGLGRLPAARRARPAARSASSSIHSAGLPRCALYSSAPSICKICSGIDRGKQNIRCPSSSTSQAENELHAKMTERAFSSAQLAQLSLHGVLQVEIGRSLIDGTQVERCLIAT